MNARIAGIRARADRLAEQGEALRRGHVSVDAVYTVVGRDGELGGGIMAGALAYRMFIWLLPFTLVLIGGVGIASDATSDSTAVTTKSLGLQGIVSKSIAEASRGSSRWYALVIGIPLLVWATRSLLKALVVVHRLVWGEATRAVAKATIGRTLLFLLLLVVYFTVFELARALAGWTGIRLLSVLVSLVGFAAWWLLVSMRLPHRGVPWYALLPGAALLAVGFEVMAVLGAYLITPRVENSQQTYGALGIAAALLFGLYVLSRLVVASAILNATIWDRHGPMETEQAL
ncbi:MAG TPA: YhjD/YihY/BrkB family envelope integrity protein [Gaiellaceae bacterium]